MPPAHTLPASRLHCRPQGVLVQVVARLDSHQTVVQSGHEQLLPSTLQSRPAGSQYPRQPPTDLSPVLAAQNQHPRGGVHANLNQLSSPMEDLLTEKAMETVPEQAEQTWPLTDAQNGHQSDAMNVDTAAEPASTAALDPGPAAAPGAHHDSGADSVHPDASWEHDQLSLQPGLPEGQPQDAAFAEAWANNVDEDLLGPPGSQQAQSDVSQAEPPAGPSDEPFSSGPADAASLASKATAVLGPVSAQDWGLGPFQPSTGDSDGNALHAVADDHASWPHAGDHMLQHGTADDSGHMKPDAADLDSACEAASGEGEMLRFTDQGNRIPAPADIAAERHIAETHGDGWHVQQGADAATTGLLQSESCGLMPAQGAVQKVLKSALGPENPDVSHHDRAFHTAPVQQELREASEEVLTGRKRQMSPAEGADVEGNIIAKRQHLTLSSFA